MSLNYVTVTGLHIQDGAQEFASGEVLFEPSGWLASSADSTTVAPSPVTARVNPATGVMVPVSLLATDNSGPLPAGWTWKATVRINGTPSYSWSFFLPSGGSRDLSALPPVIPSTQMAAYLPLSGGQMAGPLLLSEDPIASAEAATKHYVDTHSGGGGGISPPAGDIGGTAGSPTVVATHLSSPLPLAQGGTGNTTGQPAGTASGDLSGSYPSPSVARVNGVAVTGTPNAAAFPSGMLLASTDASDAAWQAPYNPVRGFRPPRINFLDEVFMGQAGHPFTFSGTGATGSNADTSDFVLGAEAVAVTTNGAGANTKISGTFGQALNMTGKSLVVWVKMSNYAHFLTGYPRVFLGDTGLTNVFMWKLAESAGQPYALDGEWMRLTLPFGTATVTGSPSRSSLPALVIQMFDDAAAQVTFRFGGMATMAEPPAFPNGVVSISFDDGYISQFNSGKPYMDKYGYPATSYVITETLWNHGSFAGYLDLPSAQALEKYSGWEIASHAYTAANHNAGYVSIGSAAALADAQAAKQYLQVQGFKSPELFAYPLGLYDAGTIGVASQLFAASRTISQLGGFPDETFPPADLTRLRAQTLGNGNSLASAEAMVDRAFANKEWLIFTFHDLQATAGTNLQWAISDFQSLMDYITAKGIPVRTVSDVLKTGTVQVDPFSADIAQIGTAQSAGSVGMPADAGHVHAVSVPLPADVGWIAWTCDPSIAASLTAAITAGTLTLVEFWIRSAQTLSNVIAQITTAGNTLTSGQNFAAIIDSAGTVRGVTADQTAAWGTTGVKTMALTSPIAGAAPGRYYAAFLANGTAGPIWRAGAASVAFWNAGLAGATLRAATNGSALTAVPGSITLASNVATNAQPICAVIS